MSARLIGSVMIGVLAALTFPWAPDAGASVRATVPPTAASGSSCRTSADPEYYSFDLERTDKLPSVPVASGRASVSSPGSPFGLTVTRDGTITHLVEISVTGEAARDEGNLVAWAADPNLERVLRLGHVSEDVPATGEIALNKFMIFVTLESPDGAAADRWQGPVILVGRSRSARLQSMASHGTFEPEPC